MTTRAEVFDDLVVDTAPGSLPDALITAAEKVTGVRVDVTAGTVTVGSSGDQPADAIAAAVDEAGYTLVAGR